MNVLHVIPSIAEESSGPTYYMLRMGNSLADAGVKVKLHTLLPLPRLSMQLQFQVKGYPRYDLFNMGFSPEMRRGLAKAASSMDIIHNNSLWMMPNLYPYKVAMRSGCKIVTSPHGTLSAWALARGRWKKRVFGALFQYPALRHTDMWHATCEKEYEEIRNMGFRQPVAIVPIGMDVPEFLVSGSEFLVPGSVTENQMKKVVFFGRLHKVKGVDRLVRAWEEVAREGWELLIAGPDCGMLEELKGIVAERKLPRVSFVGEINGHAKYEFLAAADIYVLPSDTENFGVTVAEALASGTPAIVSQGAPWHGMEREGCGRWVPIGVEPLAAALKELMAMSDDERAAMGARGREWMRRDFSWKSIGAKMKSSYEWLLGHGEKQEWIRED